MSSIRKNGGSLSNAAFARRLRSLWVIDGFLTHGFNLSVLLKVSDQYEKINCVPEEYKQADLWISDGKPDWLKQLDKDKDKEKKQND